MGQLKEIARVVLYQAIVKSQLSRIRRSCFPGDGAIILYGHRVTGDDEGYLVGMSPDEFDSQMAYLSTHYNWMKLSELIDCMKRDRPVPADSVVLTFDDGFRDNYDNAFPILKKYKIPATIFLATGCVTDGQLPWSEQLGYVFQNTRKNAFTWPEDGGSVFETVTTDQRKTAYLSLKKKLAVQTGKQQQAMINDLSHRLEVNLPDNRMLNWDQVSEMHQWGIEFGCHTRSHSLLAKVDFEYAVQEMQWSLCDLKERLNVSNPPFCFPGGSMNPNLIQRVSDIGFSSVFVPDRRKRVNNTRNSHPHNLSRIGLPNAPAFHLEAELDGPFHLIRNLYRFGSR